MAHTWRISFDPTRDAETASEVTTGYEAYHFFQDRSEGVSEAVEQYGNMLDFKDTSDIFEYLAFTQADIAEVLEVDPSTLFRWKKDQKKLSKVLTKTILDMDKVIAKGVRIFGSEEALSVWLHTPNSSLGQQKPASLLKNPYQIELVDQAMEAMSWGAVL